MAEPSIRPARQEDFPAIRSLIHAVGINPMSLDWRRFLIAVDEQGALLGCGQIKPHGDGTRELASIAVQEWARSRGIARALIEALLDRERRRPLYLMCRARLETLYVRFGFQPVDPAEMPPYFRRISRMASLFNSKAPTEDQLSVMRLD